MIQKSDCGYGYDLICDICGTPEEELFEHFDDAVDFKKENGWISRKDKKGNWEEICQGCQNAV